MPLEIASKNETGRITFKPFVGKVTAHSEYNEPGKKQRFAIEGAENFWSLSDGVRDTRPELGELPPVGTVALWTLQMAPVTGKYAGPGKFYRDVIKVEKVPADYVAPTPAVMPAGVGWSAPTPPATAEDAGYDEFKRPVASGPTHGMIGPDSKVPPQWELPKHYHERMEVIKRESIERQAVMQADGALLAALAAVKALPEWANQLQESITIRYLLLSAQLANLPRTPQAVPAAEAGKDVGDLPWGNEPIPSPRQ